MTVDTSFFSYVMQSSMVVKVVLFILLVASVYSWTAIFERRSFLNHVAKHMKRFEKEVWQANELTHIYQTLKETMPEAGSEYVFQAGFREFMRLKKLSGVSKGFVMESVERAMRVAQTRELAKLEERLPSLATIGSISPYIGLFGTVWGIMMAFHSLSGADQVTIAMVAPGIAEALVATAMGLFAAIPAVIAYNKFSHRVNQLMDESDNFKEEFVLLLNRVLHVGDEASE